MCGEISSPHMFPYPIKDTYRNGHDYIYKLSCPPANNNYQLLFFTRYPSRDINSVCSFRYRLSVLTEISRYSATSFIEASPASFTQQSKAAGSISCLLLDFSCRALTPSFRPSSRMVSMLPSSAAIARRPLASGMWMGYWKNTLTGGNLGNSRRVPSIRQAVEMSSGSWFFTRSWIISSMASGSRANTPLPLARSMDFLKPWFPLL